jgi:cell division transport system permease protein
MNKAEKPRASYKIKTSYVSTIISITLVLFMLGLLGIIVLNAKRVSDYVKENIGFSLYLQEETSQKQVDQLMASLQDKPFVRTAEYISKEEAAELLKADLGEDFVDFLGYNPLSASIDIYLKPDYAESDSVKWIEGELKKYPVIREVSVQKDLIDEVNANIRKIGIVILGFSILLLIVVIALINNTIRLAIYSKRFLIKTMQLVGATGAFIRRPFVTRGVLNGLISGVIACLLLLTVIYSVKQNMPDFIELQNFNFYLILFGAVILLGILISWISTALAVRKFLRIQSGDLY